MGAREVTTALKGRWFGTYGYVRCVVHPDKRPSLRLRDGEQGRILVFCHAGCDPTTILDKLRAERVMSGTPALTQEQRHAADKRQAQADIKRELERVRQVHQIWNRCSRLAGSPAEAYLRGRGITIPLPPSLRYASAASHPDTQILFPALVAALQSPNRAIRAIHRVYLTRSGAKAGVTPQKLSYGPTSDTAVRLAAGGPVMAVGEGIETCLSYQQLTGIPTWAALTTSGIRTFTPPPECQRLHILIDNDENDAGAKAASALVSRLTIPTEGLRAPSGKDWNDTLRGTK